MKKGMYGKAHKAKVSKATENPVSKGKGGKKVENPVNKTSKGAGSVHDGPHSKVSYAKDNPCK